MANTFKSIAVNQIGTVAQEVYTCPSNTVAVCIGSTTANIIGNEVTTKISLRKDGAGSYTDLVDFAPIPVGSSLKVLAGTKLVMEPGDTLRVESDTPASIDFILSLMEIS